MKKKIVKILLYGTIVYPVWKVVVWVKEMLDFEIFDLGLGSHEEKSDYKPLESEYKQ
jgi:hypothetical protein